ncbi:MAG: hypothetical protein FWE36_00270 [Erysipelotrichales bacterium]|nr:hypothetical protein [Erysipelotrichales bacterium]
MIKKQESEKQEIHEVDKLMAELKESREIIRNGRHYVIGQKAEMILEFTKTVKSGFKVTHHQEFSKLHGECIISYEHPEQATSTKFELTIKQGSKSKEIYGECQSEEEFGQMIWEETKDWNRAEKKTVTIKFIDTTISSENRKLLRRVDEKGNPLDFHGNPIK